MSARDPELREEVTRLRRLNAHLAAYREISQRLLGARTLEEVGEITVSMVREVFGAAGAVMMLPAGSDPREAGPWVHGGDAVWAAIPEAARQGLYDVILDRCRPTVAPDAAVFLAQHDLPRAPALRNLFAAPLRLGVLHLGAVIAYNVADPEYLPRGADEAMALLTPIAPAVSHTWLLEAREKQAGLLESIIENAGAHIAYLDREFRFLRVNKAYAEGSGHTVEELLGRRHFDLFPSEENEVVFERVRDTGEPVQYFEKPFVYADQPERGTTYWDWTLSPVKAGDEQVVGLVLALNDRTEQVRHRKQLQAVQQERLREARVFEAVLENTSSFVMYLGQDLRIRLSNAAVERALAVPSEQLVGAWLFDVVPGSAELAPRGTVAEKGIPVQGREHALSLPYAPERGVTYWDWTAVPVRGQEGEIEGVVVTANDVTEEVEARERIARAARLLETIQESTDNNLIYFDRNLRIVQANSAFLSTANRTRAEVLGKTILEILPQSGDIRALLQQARTTGEPVIVHEVAREPMPWMQQFTQYWDFAITPVKDGQGGVEGLVVSGTDVTGQVLNRERLLEQERHRTRLAQALNAELNHRVKNNLAMVAGLLNMQIAGRPREDETVAMVRQSISRLRAIAAVHEQLNETQLSDVEIVDALNRIAKASHQILAADQGKVSVQGEALFLPSRSATTLCVVVNELITNALKHGAAHHDGRRAITVTVGQESGKLRLGVWNSGNAVAEDFDLDRHAQMGLRLVQGIVVEQFHGIFSITPADSGTLAQIVVDEAALGE